MVFCDHCSFFIKFEGGLGVVRISPCSPEQKINDENFSVV